jgi:hypothetical protein
LILIKTCDLWALWKVEGGICIGMGFSMSGLGKLLQMPVAKRVKHAESCIVICGFLSEEFNGKESREKKKLFLDYGTMRM